MLNDSIDAAQSLVSLLIHRFVFATTFQPLMYTPPGYNLDADYLPPPRVGRTMLITPWRGIAFGGLATVWSEQEYTNNIWQWNPPTDEWFQYQNVEVSGLVLPSYRNASDRLRLWDYATNEPVYYNDEVRLLIFVRERRTA